MTATTPETGIVNRAFVVDSSTTQHKFSSDEGHHNRESSVRHGDAIYKKQLKKFFEDAPQMRLNDGTDINPPVTLR